MTHHSDSTKTALVLPGGGARGAFQVGVLKALAEILPRNCQNPFPVISGTSAGAVISVVLASKAEHFRSAVTGETYLPVGRLSRMASSVIEYGPEGLGRNGVVGGGGIGKTMKSNQRVGNERSDGSGRRTGRVPRAE